MQLVLDAERVVAAHVWGYSMGGGVTELLYAAAPERVLTAVIGGWATRPQAPLVENPTYRALQQGIEVFVDLVGKEMTEEARAFYLRNDAGALAALTAARPRWPQEQVRIACPTLVYAGDADPVHRFATAFASTLPLGRFISLPGAAHSVAFANIEAVLPTVRSFLAEVGTAPAA